MSFKIRIPESDCTECQFFCETEDSEVWCSLYRKAFETPDDWDGGHLKKPEFCKADEIEVRDLA